MNYSQVFHAPGTYIHFVNNMLLGYYHYSILNEALRALVQTVYLCSRGMHFIAVITVLLGHDECNILNDTLSACLGW